MVRMKVVGGFVLIGLLFVGFTTGTLDGVLAVIGANTGLAFGLLSLVTIGSLMATNAEEGDQMEDVVEKTADSLDNILGNILDGSTALAVGVGAIILTFADAGLELLSILGGAIADAPLVSSNLAVAGVAWTAALGFIGPRTVLALVGVLVIVGLVIKRRR